MTSQTVPTTPLVLQGFTYEHTDHLFGDTKPCSPYLADKKEYTETTIPPAPKSDFAYRCWKARYVEPVFSIFGVTATGDSAQVVVRGFRPSLKFWIEDETMTIETVRHQFHLFCQAVYSKSQFKEVHRDHVLIGGGQFVYLLDFYTFEGISPKRFFEVQFHSFASYNQLKGALSHLWIIHNWNPKNLSNTEITKEQERLKIILEHHFRVSKYKGKLDAARKQEKSKYRLGKESKKAVDTALERLHKVLMAYKETEYLGGKCLGWDMYDSALPPTLNFLTKLQSKSQWFETLLKPYHSTHDHEESLHTTTKIFTVVTLDEISARNDLTAIAPFTECGLDIEVYGAEFKIQKGRKTRLFPNPLHRDSVCFQIALTPHRYGDPVDKMEKILLTLGNPVQSRREKLPVGDPERIIVYRCESERLLFLKLFELLSRIDFEILYTYNGRNFDMYVIYQRCVLLGLVNEAERFGFAGKSPTKTSYPRSVTSGELNAALSRSGVTNIQQRNSVFHTAAFGMAEYRDILIPGRTHLDLLPYMRANFKFQKNSLDYVSNHFLGTGKDEMNIEDLHMAYEKRDATELMRTGEYCIQDTALLQALVSHKQTKIIENLVAMARVTFVPLDFIITRGQQIKVFSQISRKAMEQGKAIPHYIEDSEFTDNRLIGRVNEQGELMADEEEAEAEEEVEEEEEQEEQEGEEDELGLGLGSIILTLAEDQSNKNTVASCPKKRKQETSEVPTSPIKKRRKGAKKYQGATVIEPTIGIYRCKFPDQKSENTTETDLKAKPVVTLDFASLYPSIIRAFNIDYSNLIFTPAKVEKFRQKGFNIQVYEWTDEMTGTGFYVGIVCKDPKGHVVEGTLPAMLSELMTLRKSIKKEAAMEQDPQRKAMLNANQLAIKISANSAYGFCAAQTLPCPTISALVCHIGRKALMDTAALVRKAFGCTVVYGDTDSVFVTFPENLSMEALFLLSEKAAKFLTDELFRKLDPTTPMELEFEKVYSPLLMYSKKRYEGMEYTVDEYQTKLLRDQHPSATPEEKAKLIVIGKPKYKSTGVVTSRRDTTKIAGDTYRSVIESILQGGTEEAAVEIVRDSILKIQNDMIQDYSMFSITQSVKDMDSYQNPAAQAAVIVAERIRERGIDVQPGATVTYVYLSARDVQPLPDTIQHMIGDAKQIKAHTAEDTVYAEQQKLTLNRMNYIETIKNGLKPFFGIASIETQKMIALVYNQAKQLEAYHNDQNGGAKATRGAALPSDTPWFDVPDGMCPWGGTDESKTGLGSTSMLSPYLKRIVDVEVKRFKKSVVQKHRYGGNPKFALSYPANCKQVQFGHAVLELKSNDPFCPVHKRVHHRTEKNSKQILHRVNVSSTGIRFICRKEGNSEKWPPQYKDGSSSTPLETPDLKKIFKDVNNYLKKIALDFKQPSLPPVIETSVDTKIIGTVKPADRLHTAVDDPMNENLQIEELPISDLQRTFISQPKLDHHVVGCIDMGF